VKKIPKIIVFILFSISLKQNYTRDVPAFLLSVRRAIGEHKKVALGVLLLPLIHKLYAQSQKKIINDEESLKRQYAHNFAFFFPGWTIFNPNEVENLIFYFPGHKSFAQHNVPQQTTYKGNPITEQFRLNLNYGPKKGGDIANQICEIMPRFEETVLNKEYRTYFGKEGDVLLALQALDQNEGKNKEKINIIGRSRGGHVAAIIIGLLCSPHHQLLREAGINDANRAQILNKLKEGHVILSVPLIDMKETLKETRGALYGRIVNFGFLPIISGFRYNPYGISAIPFLNQVASRDKFQNPKLQIIVIFARDDKTVGVNENLRQQFIDTLKQFGMVERIDVPGGHNDHWQQSALLDLIVTKILKN